MERSLFELTPRTRWVGCRLDIHREVDSTNRVAARLARRGAPEGLVVLADAQTAGQGRMGRSFFSPGGRNLYLSLLLRPRGDPAHLPRHVFVAALAVARSVEEHLPSSVPVEIKWPNDVLLRGRKTSGINLPARIEAGEARWAVLGIGVNINIGQEEFPPELRRIATSLRAAGGAPVDRVSFGERLLEHLEREMDRFRREGFEPVLDGWRKYFRMQGEQVRIAGPGVSREIEGVVEGLDPDGALRVRSGRTLERILAGDVTRMEREV